VRINCLNNGIIGDGGMNFEQLCLKASSIEECDLISSFLQDSIFYVAHSSLYDGKEKLRLMLNRFCWEAKDEKAKEYYRVHCGLYIYNVKAIHLCGDFKKAKKEKFLNLLAVHANEHEINLLFSKYGHICVKISELLIYLKDLHEAHPSANLPTHDTMVMAT
jgi:hypothetical protein